jgi:hypothetical protein
MEQDLLSGSDRAADLAADDAACDFDFPLNHTALADHELGP